MLTDTKRFPRAGGGLTVTILRDPDVDDTTAGIAGIDALAWRGQWIVEQRMNGDQSNRGRALRMDPHTIRLYRVRLYRYPRR